VSEAGTLASALKAGKFAVTAETSPPDSADPSKVLDRVQCLEGLVDAVNVTDGAGARAHMSALACAAIMADAGIEPVLQMTTRDRNRLALQGDLIGASALGVPNILCLYGDAVEAGDQPDAKLVHDIDSRQLMTTARRMRDEGAFPTGRPIEPKPFLFIGGADTPIDPGPEFKADGLRAKIDAGADFFQSQFVFDVPAMQRYMARLRDEGITEKAYYIAGLGPILSAKSARWMNENLFGVHVPDDVIVRLEGAADQRTEGIAVCIELLEQLREIDGISGVHLMGPKQEDTIAEILSSSPIRSGG